MGLDISSKERLAAAKKKESFNKWLDDPMVRMACSSIPEGDQAGALRLLLQSAFDYGFSAGMGLILVDLMKTMFEKGGRD